MANTITAFLLFDQWQPDGETLERLRKAFDRQQLDVQLPTEWETGQDLTFDLVGDAFLTEIKVTADAQDEPPGIGRMGVSLTTHDRALLDAFPDFSFPALLKELHTALDARKTVSTTWVGPSVEEAPDLYEEKQARYGWDMAFEPYLELLIVDPAPYPPTLVEELQALHDRWAERFEEPPVRPFPLAQEQLANGHLYLQLKPLCTDDLPSEGGAA